MKALLPQSIRSRWQSLSETPFFRLFLHCVDRIFYGGEGASDGEVDLGIGVALAILAAPGAFVSLALEGKYGSLVHFIQGNLHFNPYTASSPDEYFFAVLSMIVAGAVAVWKWDSLLPDRRDYANLAHLPVGGRYLFLANLLALLLLAAILSIDINAASCILFPMVACWNAPSFSYIAVFFATHLLSVVLAAVFGFCGVLAVLSLLMALLPYRLFRKSSVYVRSALLIVFVALLMTSSSVPLRIRQLRPAANAWVHLPPPAWFAALCQSLRGIGDPLFGELRTAAVAGSIVVAFIAVAAYALSYRRCFLRSAETMVLLPAGGGVASALGLRLLDRILLRGPLQRAGCRFVLKTLFRSETHSLTWIGFTAVGVMIASNTLLLADAKRPSDAALSGELLGLPLILTYFLMFGLRLAFEIPAPLRANWIFRLGVDPGTQQCTALAKRVMIAFEIPLLAVCFGVYGYFRGWQIALVHTAVVAVMALLLIETLLLRFRKIPFTCSAPPFKDTTIVALILYVLGLFAYSGIVPALESQAIANPFPYEELIVILLLIWAVCLYASRKSLTEPERRLIFDDVLPPTVETLDLTFRR